MGGTNIKAGIVDMSGRIIARNAMPTGAGRDYQLIIDDMAAQVKALLDESGVSLEEVDSIGIGVPGTVDYRTGKVIYCTNLFWNEVPLGEKFRAIFNKPIYAENDATVAGLGESLFGSTKGVRNSVFLTLGTGVGGGIIINNRVYSGSHGAGSEIGHMIMGENFYDCNCGNNGCLETFASATAMIKYVQKRIAEDCTTTSILSEADGKPENINAKMIFDAAQTGDAIALETVDRMVKYLAAGIISIYNVLDPERIAIGGGVSLAGQYLLDKLKHKVNSMTMVKKIHYGDIVLAELGNEAGIIGAAHLGRQEDTFFK